MKLTTPSHSNYSHPTMSSSTLISSLGARLSPVLPILKPPSTSKNLHKSHYETPTPTRTSQPRRGVNHLPLKWQPKTRSNTHQCSTPFSLSATIQLSNNHSLSLTPHFKSLTLWKTTITWQLKPLTSLRPTSSFQEQLMYVAYSIMRVINTYITTLFIKLLSLRPLVHTLLPRSNAKRSWPLTQKTRK